MLFSLTCGGLFCEPRRSGLVPAGCACRAPLSRSKPRRKDADADESTMRAAVLVQQNEPVLVKDFEVPEPIRHQVLVRIAVSGICGAQINEIRGVRGPDVFLPTLLGHEGSGTVESVGDLVTKVAPGDRVVLHW